MKIVIATPLYPPEIGKTATYVKELVGHMQDNHDVTVLAFASTSEKLDGSKLITVSKFKPILPRLIEYTFTLYKATKGVDLIYAQKAVASGLPAVIVGFLRKIPVTINFLEDEAWDRSNTNKSLNEFYKEHPKGRLVKIQKFVLRRATKINVPSKFITDIIADTYNLNESKIIVNQNPPKKDEVLPFETKIEENKISTVSKLYKWKNIDNLIEAASRIKNVELIIAGDGPEMENLKTLANKLNVNVKFLGNVSNAESWYIKNTSHVYINSPMYGIGKNKNSDDLFEEISNVLKKHDKTEINSSEEIIEQTNWDGHINKLLS